jgi:hypothetical protein
MNVTPFIKLGTLITVTAVLGTFASFRFKNAGAWLPTIPAQIGAWEAIDNPPDREVIRQLGNPLAMGRTYISPFSEPVWVSVIAAGAFENYHDPTVCVTGGGFVLTSKKVFPIDGSNSGPVRAMVFRSQQKSERITTGDGYLRMIMYYWQQNRDGNTDTEARMGNYRDVAARLRTGFGAVALGKQTCLVRVYAPVDQDDKKAEQTQRNVAEISQAIYRAMKKDGAGL